MKKIISVSLTVIITALSVFAKPQIGQTSVVTLAFPFGARSAALGETFTGIADDEQALYYNPAGLGLSPLSKTWIHYSPSPAPKFIAVSNGMRNQKDVWALNSENEIYRFNGVDWVNYSVHTVDSTENFTSIAEKYSSFDNSEKLNAAVLQIKEFNDLYIKHRKKISKILAEKMSVSEADSLARFFAFLSYSEQSISNIKSYLLEFYDDSEVDDAVGSVVRILDQASGLSGIYDLKIPYTMALNGKINDIECDETGRLWVAGDNGLWRFENEWKKFAAFDGVPNNARFNSLTALAGGDIAVATNMGAYLFEEGLFTKVTGNLSGGKDTVLSNLFDGEITSVNKSDSSIYLGTPKGLIAITAGGLVNLIDSTKLVSNMVRAIEIDKGKVWIGGDEGVSYFNGIEWKKFRFTNSKVFGIAIENDNRVWFATDNGAVEYVEAKDGSPEWKVHHEKNNLNSSEINSIVFHRNDIWLATGNGISRFQHGQVRASLFFENLLPSLRLNDMWHAAVAGTIPVGEWGTIGVFMNFLSFGDIPVYNPDGTEGAQEAAFEVVGGIGYGMRLRKDFSVGVNLKYFNSRLQSRVAETQSFAVDAGILKNNLFVEDLSLGFSLLNMGPSVAYSEDTGNNAIPFTMRLGASYKPIKRATHYLLFALDLEREIAFLDFDEKTEKYTPVPFVKAIYKDLFDDKWETAEDELAKITVHAGIEFNYMDFISPRLGWMYDAAGVRNEINVGLGAKINMIAADFGIIFPIGENDVRKSQVRFSVTYMR